MYCQVVLEFCLSDPFILLERQLNPAPQLLQSSWLLRSLEILCSGDMTASSRHLVSHKGPKSQQGLVAKTWDWQVIEWRKGTSRNRAMYMNPTLQSCSCPALNQMSTTWS